MHPILFRCPSQLAGHSQTSAFLSLELWLFQPSSPSTRAQRESTSSTTSQAASRVWKTSLKAAKKSPPGPIWSSWPISCSWWQVLQLWEFFSPSFSSYFLPSHLWDSSISPSTLLSYVRQETQRLKLPSLRNSQCRCSAMPDHNTEY